MEVLHQTGEIVAERYRILNPIGQGGSSITYEAEDLKSGQRVALKALSLRGMADWKMMELFEREAEVLSILNHPGIPRYLDYCQVDTPQDRNFYIAQQLAQGQSLAALVQSGWHAQEEEIRHIAIQILEILVYLHSLTPPVIHRDIKPQNIIRRDDGQVFLVDFGAVQNTYHSTFAGSSTVVGTFGYMAPEQFRGQAVPTTDLYALGATLLFLLTHRSPADLPTDSLKIKDLCFRIQISEELADWLEKMLQPDVEDRFVSAKEALAQLRHRRTIAAMSRKEGRWKAIVGVGIAAVVAVNVFNSFKYPILNFLGFTPTAIYEAAEKGDLDTVRHYLEQGVDPNARDGSLMTPLHWVRSPQVASVLISKGADVSAMDRFGFTPLHFARSKEVAALLISKGADVSAKSKFDVKTLLHTNNSPERYSQEVRSLIGWMPFLDIGVTPLHIAQTKEVASLLIAKGADVRAKTDRSNTPLHMVRSPQVASLLIAQGAQVNARNNKGQTPLHTAALPYMLYGGDNKSNRYLKVKLLLDRGADVNALDKDGTTPLHLAVASFNDLDIVEQLIAKGADVNAQDKDGTTPLHKAVASYDGKKAKAIASLLIAKGANVNAQDKDGRTPLHKAVASYDGKEVASLLIAKGAKVNVQDKDGNTPLHVAAWNNKDLVELLIDKGADVNALDNEGMTPLHKAGMEEMALLLIAKGADVNVRDNQGNTLLHKAARNDWKTLAELLLAKGADVNAKNNQGDTPQQAAEYDNDVVELLKSHGKTKYFNP